VAEISPAVTPPSALNTQQPAHVANLLRCHVPRSNYLPPLASEAHPRSKVRLPWLRGFELHRQPPAGGRSASANVSRRSTSRTYIFTRLSANTSGSGTCAIATTERPLRFRSTRDDRMVLEVQFSERKWTVQGFLWAMYGHRNYRVGNIDTYCRLAGSRPPTTSNSSLSRWPDRNT